MSFSNFLLQHADLRDFKKEISGTRATWIFKSRSQKCYETGGERAAAENAGIWILPTQLVSLSVLTFCRGVLYSSVVIIVTLYDLFFPARTMTKVKVSWRPARSLKTKEKEKKKGKKWFVGRKMMKSQQQRKHVICQTPHQVGCFYALHCLLALLI